jgi:hypothetical protein
MPEPKLDLRDCALSDLGKVDYRFAVGELPVTKQPLLAIRFAGVASNASDGVFALMSAIVMAGLEAWEPWALILDLQGLEYAWGDLMQNVLSAPQRWYEPLYPLRLAFGGDKVPKQFPLAVVVSDLNRDGLVSLVRSEMRGQPADLLRESIDEAAQALDAALAGVPLV